MRAASLGVRTLNRLDIGRGVGFQICGAHQRWVCQEAGTRGKAIMNGLFEKLEIYQCLVRFGVSSVWWQ